MRWMEPMAIPTQQLPPASMSSRSKSPPKSGEGSWHLPSAQISRLARWWNFLLVCLRHRRLLSNNACWACWLFLNQLQALTPRHGRRCLRNPEEAWRNPTSQAAWCLSLSPKAWWMSRAKTAASSTAPFRWGASCTGWWQIETISTPLLLHLNAWTLNQLFFCHFHTVISSD